MHVLPEGVWPHTAATARLATRATCRPPWTSTRGRVIVVSAIDNLGKGAAGQAVQSANLMLGLPETTGPVRARGQPVSVTAPKGFRAAGVAAGLKAPAAPRRRRSSSTTAPTRPRPASSPPTGSRPRRCSGASRCSRAGIVRAVVLNSGGANACTGPPGFQDTHATAEHDRGRGQRRPAARRRRRRRGLLDRADRRAAADGRSCSPASTRPSRALARDGGAAAAEAIMTTDTRPKTTVRDRRRLDRRRHGQGRRHARPRPGHDALRAHHRRGRRPGHARRGAARGDPGRPSTGSTPTAACPPTTPCCCWPAAPPASRRPRTS